MRDYPESIVPVDHIESVPRRIRGFLNGALVFYKGHTSGYWSVAGAGAPGDVAGTYDFPTQQLSPIAGLFAFYNKKVDVFLAGELLERPETHFSSPRHPA